MLVRDLVEKVDPVYMGWIKFFDFENDVYLDTIEYDDLYENDYKIKDNEVYRFTWYECDLWVYI